MEPKGSHQHAGELGDDVREQVVAWCAEGTSVDGGVFLPVRGKWPLPALGVPHFSGRFLRTEERDYLLGHPSSGSDLYRTLVEAGLLLRPGFKYGCRWRAYEDDIEVAHAPWLIQPRAEAPTNWEEVCLSVRLAEGVNKRWLCADQRASTSSFLNIKRVG